MHSQLGVAGPVLSTGNEWVLPLGRKTGLWLAILGACLQALSLGEILEDKGIAKESILGLAQ
jgi:hypothetical protein